MGQLSSYTNTFTSGTDAVADEVNQNFTDIKDAHNATDTSALYKDGTKAMTGNLAMGSHKITGLANGTVSTDAVNKSQLDAVNAVVATAILKDGSVDFEAAESYFSHSITEATNATPIVITIEDHLFADNDYCYITGVLGNTAANGKWQITYIDEDTFSLDGSVGNGAYTSGGTAYFVPNDLENLVNKAYVDETLTDYCDVDLSNISATGISVITNAGMPDYENGVSKSVGTTYTATSDGWVYVLAWANASLPTVTLTINSVSHTIVTFGATPEPGVGALFPISKNDTYILNYSVYTPTITFYPMKGAN